MQPSLGPSVRRFVRKVRSGSCFLLTVVKMRSVRASLLLLFVFFALSETTSPEELEGPSAIEQQVQKKPTYPFPRPGRRSTTAAPAETTTSPTEAPGVLQDEFLGPEKCLSQSLTRRSCDLVFCPPWERCVDGQCSCKPPYLCPTDNVTSVCGHDDRVYRSYCQVMALSCRKGKNVMSHFGEDCEGQKSTGSIVRASGLVRAFVPSSDADSEEELMVCSELWDMAAANVACRADGKPLGAESAGAVSLSDVPAHLYGYRRQLAECLNIRCQGYEHALSECVIYNKTRVGSGMVAMATCYQNPPASNQADCGSDFLCANGKCVSKQRTCDGVDDCGDRSDEMCCQRCRNDAFLCRTGVCLHREAVHDGVRDCLDGADEAVHLNGEDKRVEPARTERVSPKNEIRTDRLNLESQLECGIPNMDLVDNEEHGRGRVKRVVGGIPSKPTQIQWQVAVEERGKVDCGGAYIGGCWVLTAAHCVRPNPSAFRVKFSLWRKTSAQDTTDIVPVEDITIHHGYDPATYENDIALLKLEKLPFLDKCFEDNPAIRAVCLPWSTRLFQPNHTCSISGWGRTAAGKTSQVLLWANVSLIDDCDKYYGERFKPGMMCAGDLEGKVDSCQGDSGGPLVCEDELGVSYLWGIVSWGEQCGKAGFPGVYTQVADYFQWIRLYTGWPAVTKFNS
ncbi:complement factor I [Echeneis naucrates]|uniref:complement factor I n=1 Tax=Echeneis naucrates TaxID=173247 RepID=UPI00111358DB|nr:complement factor I [Echeneis naucrates]